MIDKDKLAGIRSGAAFPLSAKALNIEIMDQSELLRLRGEIDKRLPATLQDLDLERELLHQFVRVKELQEVVLDDDRVAANQKAQVASAVAATLQQLVKMQTDWNTSERLKEIEGRLIKALVKMPNEYLEDFFEWYEGGQEQ